MNVAGTVADWRENVGRLCAGNSRLILAVSAAFAAPLLYWTVENGGGFHFRGASSSGKSTALIVAGSVWGGGTQGFVQNLRVTENGLEVLASLHNHALLCLDELSQIDAGAARPCRGRDGKVTEWRSKALPRYQRLTKKAEALIAAVYLAGTNTRRDRLP